MRAVLLLILFIPCAAFAGGSTPLLDISGGTVLPGETITSSVVLEHFLVANGWSLSVCHDPAVVELDSFGLGAEGAVVNGGSPPDFVGTEVTEEGWAQGVVISLIGLHSLPEGTHELAVADYTGIAQGQTTLCPCLLDVIPPPNTFIVYSGQSVEPITTCGEITVPVGPYFVRGDANVDGSVDVGDAVEILNTLFGGGGTAPCLEAADVNADAVVDIADPIALLAYLFSGGDAPSAPFPECGADESVTCALGSVCP